MSYLKLTLLNKIGNGPEHVLKLLNIHTSIQTMTELDQNYNADLLDAMADIAYEQEQAMRESNQEEWILVEHPLTHHGD